MRRALRLPTTAVLVASTLASLALPARAQAADHRTPRSLIMAIVGALAGGAVGLVFGKSSGDSGGACAKIQCVIVGSVVAGAGLGYLVGRQMDIVHASRYRGVRPITIRSTDAELTGIPVAISAGDSMVAVGGSAGVQMVGPAGVRLAVQARRAGGLRGIATIALAPSTAWLAAGSPAGLYVFPPHQGPGSLLQEGDVDATAATATHVYFASGARVFGAPFRTDTTAEWPSITLDSPAHDLALDSTRDLLWAVTDRSLVALRIAGDSLALAASVPLGSPGLGVAVVNDTAAVALGDHGVAVFDTHRLDDVRRIATWTIAHFAYDVAIDQHRLFVAAGPEGVYVIALDTVPLRTIGLARGLGFASALASHDGYTYILDRRTNALRRIYSDF